MYPNNNISQTISDLSFVDYGSSSGKWRANKKINFDPFSFYGSGLILSGKDYLKKSFGNNSDNRFDNFLVEFYATGNNYEIDFIKNGQTNLSIERTGNSNGGFLLNYRGSSASFSETGATGFYSFNFKNTGINPIYLFGKASGSLVYHDNEIKTPNGYFGSGIALNTNKIDVIVASVNNNGTSSFNLDSFTIDFLCKYTGVSFADLDFLTTRTKKGSNYPSRNNQNPLVFTKNFNGFRISLHNNFIAILNMPIISGDWSHISITSNKIGTTNYLSGYTNGILKDSNTFLGDLFYGYSLPISGLDISEYSFNNHPGSIFLDEIRMWSGAKSSGEVNNLKFTELKSDPLLYNDPNLLYHVSFDEITTQNKNIDFYKNGNLSRTNVIKNIYTGYLDYSNIKVTGQCEFDEFRFWSGVRTAGQISAQAKSGIGMDLFPRFRGGAYGVINPTMNISNNYLITQSGYFTSGFILDFNNNDFYSVPEVRVYASNPVLLKNLTFDFLIKTKSNGLNFSIYNFITFNQGIFSEELQLKWEAHSNYTLLGMSYDSSQSIGVYRHIEFDNPNNVWNHYYFTMNLVGSNWLVSGYLNGQNFSMGSTFSSIPSSDAFGSNFRFNGVLFERVAPNPYSIVESGQELILDEFRCWSGIKTSGEMNELRFKKLGSKSEWMNDPNLLLYTPFSKSEFYAENVNTGNLSNYQSRGLYSYPLI